MARAAVNAVARIKARTTVSCMEVRILLGNEAILSLHPLPVSIWPEAYHAVDSSEIATGLGVRFYMQMEGDLRARHQAVLDTFAVFTKTRSREFRGFLFRGTWIKAGVYGSSSHCGGNGLAPSQGSTGIAHGYFSDSVTVGVSSVTVM